MKQHYVGFHGCAMCRIPALAITLTWLLVARSQAADWPQWRGAEGDGVWREEGLVDRFTTDSLKTLWRAPIGPGYSGPTVADGRVYVSDRQTTPTETERVHCFDAKTGNKLWTREYACPYEVEYPQGPRAVVAVADGRAYALGTMGDFHCLDSKSGEVLWAKNLKKEYELSIPTWGLSASPLVEAGLVIVHIGKAGGGCVVAFDPKTGAERWRAIDDVASYSSPIVIEHAGRRMVVCWSGNYVTALDPKTGKIVWQQPFKAARGIVAIATPVFDGKRLFVSSFFDGSLMLRLRPDAPAPEVEWRRKGTSETNSDALHALIAAPILDGDYLYGMDSYGEMRCLRADNGDRVWEDLTILPKARWASVHMARQSGRVWMFTEAGELILCTLDPKGFHPISRARIIEPVGRMTQRAGGVCWGHPAFANKCIYARSDGELVCVNLAAN